jgi:hypothetical protein
VGAQVCSAGPPGAVESSCRVCHPPILCCGSPACASGGRESEWQDGGINGRHPLGLLAWRWRAAGPPRMLE